MQVSLGHPARLTGQVLAVGSILMTLTSPIAGFLADRISPRVISSLGVFGVLASAVVAATLAETSSLTAVTVVLAVQGLGFALFSSPNMTTIMNSVPADATSMASALAAKSRTLGMVTGMLITAVLISLGVGNDPIDQHPIRFIAIMGNVFIILTAVSALALVVSVAGRARR
jgi:MFS family permease